MELRKEYKNVISFQVLSNHLFVLDTNRNYSNIMKIDNNTEEVVWQQGFEQYIYEFVLLGNKIYATTGIEPQKTFVLSSISGDILDDNFKAVLHLPLFSKSNERFICFATYNGENVDLRFTKDLIEIEVVGNKDFSVTKRLNENYYLNLQKEIVHILDYAKHNIIFQLNLSDVIRDSYSHTLTVKSKVYHVELQHDVLVMGVSDLKNYKRYLFGISLESGKMKWHHQNYNNFELHNGKIYNIEFYGLYRVLNPENGEVEQEADLQEEFKRMEINCEHRFNVTDTHIYFKNSIKGKFGILNTKTLKIEEVQQLPENNTMSTEEFPIRVGNRLFVRSAPQNKLFIYQLD